MQINMISYSEDNLLPEGKYLVKTESKNKCGTWSLKSEQFLEARLTNVFDNKKNKFVNRLDISNQVPILISDKKLF